MSEKTPAEPETFVEGTTPGQLPRVREMRQSKLSPSRVCDRNLEAKRVLAEELTSMGYTEAQVRRILHISRHDSSGSPVPGHTERRGK
jgi:hypothetical protein